MATTTPATGVSWTDAGFTEFDNRLYDRGSLSAILIRDNRGAATDISPWTISGTTIAEGWSPLAADNTIRNDLLARRLVAGVWTAGTTGNLGFYLTGATEEKGGPDRKPAIKHDDAMILESNFPFDSDITGEGLTIAFTPVQPLDPMLRRVKMNLPLQDPETGDNIAELPGVDIPYVVSKPVAATAIERQILCVFGRQRPGGYVYNIEAYPVCKLTEIGSSKRDKVTPDASALTFTVLPDPFHMGKDAANPASTELVPAYYSIWTGGAAWAAMAA